MTNLVGKLKAECSETAIDEVQIDPSTNTSIFLLRKNTIAPGMRAIYNVFLVRQDEEQGFKKWAINESWKDDDTWPYNNIGHIRYDINDIFMKIFVSVTDDNSRMNYDFTSEMFDISFLQHPSILTITNNIEAALFRLIVEHSEHNTIMYRYIMGDNAKAGINDFARDIFKMLKK